MTMLSVNHIKQSNRFLLLNGLGIVAVIFLALSHPLGATVASFVAPYPFLLLGYATGFGTALIVSMIASLILYIFGSEFGLYFSCLQIVPALIALYIHEQDTESLSNKMSKTILALTSYFILGIIALNYLLYFQDSSLEMIILASKAALFESLTIPNAIEYQLFKEAVDIYFNYAIGLVVVSSLLMFFLNWFLAYQTSEKFIKSMAPIGKIEAIELPFWALVAFIGSVLCLFLPTAKLSFVLQNILMILEFLYLIRGAAFIHFIVNLRVKRHRPILYTVFYITLCISFWLPLLTITLGVLDHVLGLKKRINHQIQF